jgi:hypothetical protein
MSEPSGRPPFHPDFDVLSEAIVQVDALSDSGAMTVLYLVKEVADPDTATYFAAHRGAMIAELLGLDLPLRKVATLGGLWLDGLLAGYKLCQAHERRK